MKNSILVLLILFSATSLFANADEAVSYNDKIIAEQTKIGEQIMAFSGTVNEFSLQSLREQIDKSIAVLNKMKPYKGNKSLLNNAKKLFKFYASITDGEYKEMLKLIEHRNKYTDDELKTKLDKLSEKISKQEKLLDANFQRAQKEFALEYGFTLTTNPLEEKIKNQ